MLELNEDFLNLLAYDESSSARNPSILHQKPQITLGRKIQEIETSLLEITMNKVEDVDGVHGVVLVLPPSSFSSSPILSSVLSLSSSRVHPCSWGVEREKEGE